MKRAFLFLMFTAMIFSLTACQNNKTKLIWAVPEFYLPNENVVVLLNNKLSDLGNDYKVEFVGIKDEDGKTYSDIIKEKITSGDKIDILYSEAPSSLEYDNYNSAYYRFAVEGIFEPLGDLLETEAGKRLLKVFPQPHLDAMTINGEIYGINGALTTLSTDNFLFLNKENNNISWNDQQSYTFTEVCDLLKESMDSGNSTPIKFSSQYIPYYYFANCTKITDCIYINDNDVVSVLDDREYVNFLIKCKEMQQNGIITDGAGEQLSQDYYIDFEDCVGGYELSKSLNKSEAYSPYIMIPLENENYIRFSNIGTGICTTSTEKDKAFELLSLCFTDEEINNILVFGEENVDYTLYDGIPINTDGYENIRIFTFGNRLICYPLKYETENKCEDYREAYNNALIPDCMTFVFDDSSTKEKVVITNQIINDYYNSILNEGVTPDTIETLTEEYKALLNNNGLQEIISELTKQYTEFLSHKGE